MNYSILIPIYNNEATISQLYDRLIKNVRLFNNEIEFLFINDASTDNSLELLLVLQKLDKRIKIIDLQENYGQANVFYLGLKYGIGNYFIFISADLQEDEFIIEQFILKSIDNPKADLIIGIRESNNDFILFRFISVLFYSLLRFKFSDLPKKGFDTACLNDVIAKHFIDSYQMNDFIQTQIVYIAKHIDSVNYHRHASQDKSLKSKSILFKIRYFLRGLKLLISIKKNSKNTEFAQTYDFKIKNIYR